MQNNVEFHRHPLFVWPLSSARGHASYKNLLIAADNLVNLWYRVQICSLHGRFLFESAHPGRAPRAVGGALMPQPMTGGPRIAAHAHNEQYHVLYSFGYDQS